MPALQQLYVAFTQLKFAEPAVNDIYNSLSKLKLEHNYTDDNIITAFENRLSIEGITYKYLSAEKEILKNLSIEIYSNSTVGFVGETGSGKTTLVDVILGLLEPKAGSVKVDGVELTKKNIQQWRKKIGYVQQNVYLTDEDIVSNIAYGIDKDKVDLEEVVRVAKIAEIHDFIINELSNGYQTNIGERGVRLSGGQKQRIGIARALYGRPAILILDEATSALDNITEKKVMNNIRAVSEKLSLIIIAHRLSTIEFCDTIYLFKQGRIIANGTYRYLSEKNSEFIHLVRGGV
jgi:ABC-type multidrug transport system fused ATPase/permease subunit